MFNRIKGTQDYLDLSLFNFIIDKAKLYLKLYNFTEIMVPILEPLELFKRSLGQETDVVTKEMYTVNTGHTESTEEIALRPEGTAPIVRAFVDNNINLTPWKVFSLGAMFRHERPQKGRMREFHQLTMEIIGSKSINQDANFIKMLDRFFSEQLTLDSYALFINFLGCQQDLASFKEILKTFLDKISEKACTTCNVRKDKNIMRVFDCKNPACQDLYKQAPHITDNLCQTCLNEWTDLKNNLEHLSVTYCHVPTLVRGLDYYEKTVFEFVSCDLGAQNTFCGGGRYNQLAKFIGSKEDQPSLGAAMGIERLLLLLEPKREKLKINKAEPLFLILPVEREQQALALILADELQANNLTADILLEGDSLKSMMRKANKLLAESCIIIGPDEQNNKIVTVKNLATGHEDKIAQIELVSFLRSKV